MQKKKPSHSAPVAHCPNKYDALVQYACSLDKKEDLVKKYRLCTGTTSLFRQTL